MVSLRLNQAIVRRVRVKGRKLDPLVAQLRLDNILQSVELHPSWLPSSAIVCVRRLQDPMPRAVRLQSRTATQPWQRAVSASVQEEIRRAVRPISVDVPPDANAVIFRDQAEMLACLAIDWLEGRLHERWWWRSLIKGQFSGGIVADTWLSAPQYVPAALELLAINRRLESFARALSVDRARSLWRQITRSFALSELETALDAGSEQLDTAVQQGHDQRDETMRSLEFEEVSEDTDATGPRLQTLPPWRQLVPEGLDRSLGAERQCLIGVALTIRRSLTTARSIHFARATLNWLRTAGTVRIVVRAGNSTESFRSPDALLQGDLPLGARDEGGSSIPSRTTGVAVRESRPTEETHLRRDAIESTDAQNEWSPDAYEDLPPQSLTSPISSLSSALSVDRGPQEAVASEISQSTASLVETSPRAFSEASETPCAEAAPDRLTLDEVRVETQFGGFFYLLNLGLFLELYADFTRPLGTNLDLPIFDFIELVGRRLLNENDTDDPLWTLLAEFSGRRESDGPGYEFEPSVEWRLPAQWLEAFPDESIFEWTIDNGRLLVKHRAGFLLLDVPHSGATAKQLREEMVVYRTNAKRRLIRKSFSFSRGANPLEQWLDWIVPYARARLSRAMGIDDASDPASLLCRQPASICLTAVHLDIFFSLSRHPLEIRLAGLDRDPGWVPSAGRFIRFHYQ